MRVSQFACAVLALCLTACVQPPRGARADWEQGARRARVIDADDPALVRELPPSCLPAAPVDGAAAHRLVKVRYWHGARPFTDVAEAPPGLDLRAGDEVELWPEACPARISRLLAASSQ